MTGTSQPNQGKEPSPGGSQKRTPSQDEFLEMQASPEFQELRTTFRKWIFPMAVAFLIWYFLYVLLAIFATDFMSIKLLGNINVGLVVGLLQFVSTFGITALYIRFANRELDPRADRIRNALEGEVA